MSSPPKIVPSTSNTDATRQPSSNSNTPPLSMRELESIFETWFSFDLDDASASPATRSTSLHSTENSETTVQGAHCDGGTLDNASSVTLEDESTWHECGANKGGEKIPDMIVPLLLQADSHYYPPRSFCAGIEGVSRVVDEERDPNNVSPRYSARQKGKRKDCAGDNAGLNSDWVGTEGPQFGFVNEVDSAEEWVLHNRPILQEYADRQVSLPLGRRLEVSIDKPSQFVLGALQLLVNRDQPGCVDSSRKLGPQLIENFVDIERWAREYFRSRHNTRTVDSGVPTLLTIVLNNLYEAQVQLIDQLVGFALENMQFCGRSTLGVEDFAFGFDFNMSQDMPFYVETCSQVRKPISISTVEVCSTVEPVTTSSGRHVKPTRRAQESAEQAQTKQNKENNRPQTKDKPITDNLTTAAQKTKASAPQTSSDGKITKVAPAPSKTTPARTKHRPTRTSILALPPITPGVSPIPRETSRQSDDGPKFKTSEPATVASSVSAVSKSNTTQQSLPRLTIKLRLRDVSTSKSVLAANKPGRTLADASGTPPIQERVTRRSERARPEGPRNCGSVCGGGTEVLTTAKTSDATSAFSVINALPTIPPLDAGDADASAVNAPESPTNPINAPKKGSAGTSSARPHRGVDSTRKSVLRKADPGHPRRKKRKLDECEG